MSGLSSHVPHSNRGPFMGRQSIEQKTLGGDLLLALKMVGCGGREYRSPLEAGKRK